MESTYERDGSGDRVDVFRNEVDFDPIDFGICFCNMDESCGT